MELKLMCYGIEIINFLELNSLLTLDRLLINLFYFWKGCLIFFWVSLWIHWVLRIFVGSEFRYFLFWFGFCVYCLSLMISNVTISLLLGFADCASSSQIWQMNNISLCKKMQQLDNLRIGGAVTATSRYNNLLWPLKLI